MFRKKTRLPARPKPPDFEQIQEDISNAPFDDILFTTLPNLRTVSDSGEDNSQSLSQEENDFEESTQSEEESEMDIDLDELFDKVKKFVDVNTTLDENVKRFHTGCDKLLESRDELKEDAERIRTHIANALRKQDEVETIKPFQPHSSQM